VLHTSADKLCRSTVPTLLKVRPTSQHSQHLRRERRLRRCVPAAQAALQAGERAPALPAAPLHRRVPPTAAGPGLPPRFAGPGALSRASTQRCEGAAASHTTHAGCKRELRAACHLQSVQGVPAPRSAPACAAGPLGRRARRPRSVSASRCSMRRRSCSSCRARRSFSALSASRRSRSSKM